MINIDLLEKIIIIEDSSGRLKASQTSQLTFWGFRQSPKQNNYKLKSSVSQEEVNTIILKVIKYLDKEKIPFSLSVSCEKCVSQLYKEKDEINKIRKQAKDYKDGNYDNAEFNRFITFVSRHIPRTLKGHQVKATFHHYLIKNAANFSVPGSGKTAVILTLYEKLKLDDEVNMLFVVGPVACFRPWRTEFADTLGREPIYKILAGGEQDSRKSEYFCPSSKKSELYLTTYQTLVNDQNEVSRFFQQKGIKAFLVIDEAHYIKQIGGIWASAILHLSKFAKYRCILTGTPMPRSYTDIFNLFDFLWPHNSPFSSENKIRIKNSEEKGELAYVKKVLEETTGPYFYRVRKSELGLIPPVFHPPYVITMNKYEKIVYEAIVKKIGLYSEQDYLKNIELLLKLRRGRIIRLRQGVSYVKLLSTAVDNYNEDLIENESNLSKIIYNYDNLELPAKLEYLNKLVAGLQQKNLKVVIWAHFIKTLELIVDYLKKEGFYCKLIYGKTPIEYESLEEEESREKIRNEFIDPQSGLNILVANPGACGESVSLHKTCFHAIYYDLSYNCAQYLQSLDRIHRVGGSEINRANYHFLQYKDTIDQDIKANLDKKAQRMYEVIEEDYNIYSLDMFEEDYASEAYKRLFSQ